MATCPPLALESDTAGGRQAIQCRNTAGALAEINYRIHTDAIKMTLISPSTFRVRGAE